MWLGPFIIYILHILLFGLLKLRPTNNIRIAGMLCRDKRGTSAPISDELSAQDFMDAFTKKVKSVPLATKDVPCPNFNGAGWMSFQIRHFSHN